MKLSVENYGPIPKGEVTLKDITVLVGPHAVGKSLVLQLIKLVKDFAFVKSELERNNYVIESPDDLVSLYYGYANITSSILKKATIHYSEDDSMKEFNIEKEIKRRGRKDTTEKVFYIPSQRVMTFAGGWPKPFASFDLEESFVTKHFSEIVRVLLDEIKDKSIFPVPQRIKESYRNKINEHIFHDSKVEYDKSGMKKKLILQIGNEKYRIPFSSWSAGQKEFVSMLIAFYYLIPPSKISKKEDIEYVVIEEPEMGLHPRAIKSVLLLIVNLLARGYKVIISTHSVMFLEFLWILKNMKEHSDNNLIDKLFELFDISKKSDAKSIKDDFKKFLKKEYAIYFFNYHSNKKSVNIDDISNLEFFPKDETHPVWGELYSFNDRATSIVAELNSKKNI